MDTPEHCDENLTFSLQILNEPAMLYRILLLGCLYSLASCDVVVMGSPGPKGEKGEPGLPGAIGSKGEKGDRGLNGDSGFQVSSAPVLFYHLSLALVADIRIRMI